MTYDLIRQDALKALKKMPGNSFDALLSDPPTAASRATMKEKRSKKHPCLLSSNVSKQRSCVS